MKEVLNCIQVNHLIQNMSTRKAVHNFVVNEIVDVIMGFEETEVEIKAHQPKSNTISSYYLG